MGKWGAWSHLNRLTAALRPSSTLTGRPSLSSFGRLPGLQTHGFSSPPGKFFSAISAVSDSFEGGFAASQQDHVHRDDWDTHDEEGPSRFIPVKAYFLSTSIDLKSVQTESACCVIPPSSRSSNYIALRYSDYPPSLPVQDLLTTPLLLYFGTLLSKGKLNAFGYLDLSKQGVVTNENDDSCRYVVVFQYGSIVLFNIADHEAAQYLDIVRKHAHGLLYEMRKDDYAVVEKPRLATWMHGGADHIALKSLDMDGIRIICNVLGQSIALDHYIGQVDDMVKEFTDINRHMEKSGTFTMERKKLFQLMGKANSNLADVILKLGLFDRSDIAWKNSNYAQVLEYLREEYELAQRFGSLNFKLKFVEHNIHFLQEALQTKKSSLMEWVIIILLLIEDIISMYEILKTSSMVPF